MIQMTERLLQFIWQFQYYDTKELTTTAEEPLKIIFPGQYNTNQGPDFSNARIKLGRTTWAGTIELHCKTSDWDKHKHQHDTNYNNVVLHVVWEDDSHRNPGSLKPTPANARHPIVELKGRVSGILLKRYEELMASTNFIPCEKNIQSVRDITWKSWKDRLLAERLLRKAATVEQYLEQNKFHWEETFWWLLARNFGIKVNADAFEEMARSIPLKILAKHKTQIHQLEAILLGQAGLLNEKFSGNYPQMLQREYQFQKNKYGLNPISVPVFFLRMRPGNFPTVRLGQLAMLIHGSAHLFSKIKEADSVKDVKTWFAVTANDYWHYHYHFDEKAAFKKKKLGMDMVNNIIINTVAPVLFAYGNYNDEHRYKEKALQWLEETEAENNNITNGFKLLGIESRNAFDSQGLIELKNEYCSKKRCLDCGAGNSILKS
jgi:Protein of unknown function (DUF2851)